MKNLRTYLLACLIIFSHFLYAQNNRERSILATATVQTDPPEIVVSWPQNRIGDVFILKDKTEPFFQLPSGTNSFTDTDVEVGKSYEYDIYVVDASTAGYIKVAIEEEMQDINGRLLLVIDDQFQSSLEFEISRLEADIESEGWIVDKIYVNRDWTPQEVKQKIINENEQSPLSSLFLLGHVPIPLSGNYASDGHTDHQGAWPADTYYGDLDGEWTDLTVFSTNATRATNFNVPGDGRFDQSVIPSDIELEVGRVDLWDMPDFGLEEDLLRNYLDKNHAFRTKQISSIERALIDDNFPNFDIAPWSWRSFTAMFGEENIVSNTTAPSKDYFTELQDNNYLWSFGCGGGSFTSCGGVVNSSQYAFNSLNTIFTSLSGSYFGDFNSTNNLLRAPLASSSPTLVNFWGGIPTWAIHEMTTGSHIGHCTKLSQNNNINNVGGYAGNFNGSQRRVHIALMGDPTLKMHISTKPANLQTSKFNSTVSLTWDAAAHTSTLGYHVYRMDPVQKTLTRLTNAYVTETSFSDTVDSDLKADKLVYFVRAVSLKSTPSGTYYNLSSGACDTLLTGNASFGPDLSLNNLEISAEPSCSGVDMQIAFEMCGAESLTSFDIEFTVDNGPLQTLSWQGNLDNGGTDIYDLLEVDISPGPHTIVITLTNPNGLQDLFDANNTLTKDFDVIKGNEVFIDLSTDQNGKETYFTWYSTSAPNTPILTRGGFSSNEDYTLPFCLEDGCYIVKINDFGGNGICCSSGEGSYQVSSGGITIVEGGEFEMFESTDFCLPIACVGFNAASIEINSDLDPSIDISEETYTSCAGVEVTLTASGGDTYLWENGATTQSTTFVLLANQFDYSVTVTNIDGCSVVDFASFNVIQVDPVYAGEDLNVCPGSQVTLNASAGPGTFYWENIEGQSYTVSPTETTEYEVLFVSAAGCEFTDFVTVTVENFEVESSFSSPTCVGLNDASASVEPVNGTAPFSYQWDTGSSSNSISNIFAGTYTVTISDLYNCTNEINIEITEPEGISIVIEASNETVVGASDGMAIANPTGGTAPYNYLWSNNETTQIINMLAPGNYVVTVTDDFGCSEMMSVEINSGGTPCNGITVSLAGQNLTCFESNDGSIVPAVENAIGAISFSWSNGSTEGELSNLEQGTYGLTVTDENNCTAEASVEINSPEVLAIETSNTEINCFGEEAMATVTATGGTSPYSYSWSNGSSSAIITGLEAGAYTVTLTDSNGCERISELSIAEANEIVVEFNISDLDCFGEEDGSIEALVTGGTGPYSIAWANGSNNFSLEDLPAGEIAVTVTDADNCTTEAFPFVEAPEELILDFDLTAISCADASDGQLTAMLSGGVEPYAFAWSNGSSEETVADLEPGIYELTIIDSNDCVQTGSMELSNPPSLVINGSSSNETLEGAADGMAEAEILGGTPPYDYMWNNGETTAIIENLSPGEYTFQVTDANGCTDELTVTISSGSDPCDSFSINLSASDVTCLGGLDGAASVEVENATGLVFINWSTGDLGIENIENLEAGIYTVTVSDENACVQEASIEIGEGSQIQIEFETTDVICNGDENGTIQSLITGGTGPYDLVWSNGESNMVITNLAIGEYSLEVTDANGCSASGTTIISTPFPINASVNTSNESITGQGDGSASLSLSGGTGDIDILWLNLETNFQVGSNTLSVEDLSPGIYIVLLTDENGCRESIEFSIGTGSDPCLNFNASANIENEISCFADSDASILVSVNNANGDYSVSLNGSALNDNIDLIENLSAGIYEITISDEQDCSTDLSIEIVEPSELIGTILSTDVSCFGAADGTSNVEVQGGTGDYSFIWSNGSTEANLENLDPGSYDLSIADANDCIIGLSIEVTEPEEIEITTSSSPIICDTPGSINVMATGGSGEFEYVWQNGTVDAFPIEVVNFGSYEFTIIDGLCTETVDVIVEQDSYEIATLVIDDYQICFGEIFSVSIPETENKIEWNTGDTTYVLDNVVAGDYAYTLTDEFGCTGTSSFSVFESEALIIGLSTTAADNGDNGTASASVNNGNTIVTYEWSTGETSMSIENLTAGMYSLTVTDEFGCQETQTFEIEDLNTSTNTISDLNSIDIYPNPAKDQLNIVLEFKEILNYEIAIIGILGKTYFKQEYYASNANCNLSVSHLIPGTYFITIKTRKGSIIKKIHVMK